MLSYAFVSSEICLYTRIFNEVGSMFQGHNSTEQELFDDITCQIEANQIDRKIFHRQIFIPFKIPVPEGERFFEIIKEESKSYSRSTNAFSMVDSRVNVSERERAKHRGFEFFKLNPGEFFVFDDKGNDYKMKLKQTEITPAGKSPIYIHSTTEIRRNFDDLLADCKELV